MSKPITNEPTHEGADGEDKPGAIDLRSTITPTKIKESDDAFTDFYADQEKRNRYSAQNPQIAEPYSPLRTLIYDALREYGEMNPGTMFADTAMLFIRLANKIIEDMRAHPYYEQPDIDYYTSLDETRQIPDILMHVGLQYYYSVQQASEKAKLKSPEYFQRLNTVMYNRRYGNGKIEIEPYD